MLVVGGLMSPVVEGASDLTLLRRLRKGEDDAATQLYLRYARRLQGLARKQSSARLARRVDPEEIVQSVFRTFFRRVQTGDYDIPPGEELWRLLLVITLNKIRRAALYHHAERRDVRRTVGINYRLTAASESETALATLQMVIADVIRDLPPAKAEMVRLRIDGHEIDEIVTRTKRSKRTVERTLQDFRGRLRGMLEEVPERERS